MKNYSEENIMLDLDIKVKEIGRLLNQLEPDVRLEYIKNTIPALFFSNKKNKMTAQQKLKDHRQAPVQKLSTQELEQIEVLAKKTETLYNAMNSGSYFD